MNNQNTDIVRIRTGAGSQTACATTIAGQFADYALLSANAYDSPSDTTPVLDWSEAATQTGEFRLKAPDDWCWRGYGKFDLPSPDWWRLPLRGLGYHVWDKEETDGVIVAIVFRGTDLGELGDLLSDLRWLFRFFLWDQYHQVRRLMPQLVKSLQEQHGDRLRKIVSTGHSLGGALAQHAAYATPHIKEVIAFNPSPVTGYFEIPEDEAKRNSRNINIARVYERGEFLSYARFVTRQFHKLDLRDPAITEFGFDFADGNLFAQHKMQTLAIHLNRLADAAAKTGHTINERSTDYGKYSHA